MIFDKERTYNKGLTIAKTLKAGNHEILVTIAPFQDVTIKMVARVNGKEVDRYTGRDVMDRNSFPIRWWVDKHTPKGVHWSVELTNWYAKEVIPVVEAETVKRNLLPPSSR
ncbi:hypothetical protein A2473_03640 [candidate division WWE3 bacterium RIFOXYC2_FULL_42_13]|uniref:Uncharacterized protein n=1 Tax=candidate division WWE3 bacterium TaxID=2053526 RepID=A0A3D0ZQ48_UNCKA|nr:MAG: hypothetical protein A2245_00080 [candidate division WWE3 bacterium RIFOXYA2_FULL_43_12]OGC64914.1 MAG: hypothetical protein A2274_00230 [candidate division WWE3 bacterium RIFOXYA12_FULL_43_11]OGC72670.1 MAG: hypothetical protein A2473_03640 [candidate division WWE3 bacterium RIFOXYC2_FULL_42_13]OGC73961.1 MAG: hypothetical protein A2337_00995 [candidate division WWE3 bacterium RIFOXYB2_FULL_43_9]HCC42226.1 hypothetical protein [candidate division WWE3 bacterium]